MGNPARKAWFSLSKPFHGGDAPDRQVHHELMQVCLHEDVLRQVWRVRRGPSTLVLLARRNRLDRLRQFLLGCGDPWTMDQLDPLGQRRMSFGGRNLDSGPTKSCERKLGLGGRNHGGLPRSPLHKPLQPLATPLRPRLPLRPDLELRALAAKDQGLRRTRDPEWCKMLRLGTPALPAR